MSRKERIKELEEELQKTKSNKRTQGAIGLLKARISRLKEDVQKKSSSKGKTSGYAVKKSGDATIVLLGFPSVGKSTLLNALCNTESPVAEYSFTTLSVIPGAVVYKGAKFQILDVPGIVYGAASGKGRGREVLSVIRNADLVLIVIDATNPGQFKSIIKEVRESGVRINQTPPQMKIKKKAKGGISVSSTVKLKKMLPETIKGICRELRITNADVLIKEDMDVDRFIDGIEANKVYIPGVVAINKSDLISTEERKKVKSQLNPDIFISANKKKGMVELLDLMYERLQFMRIYLKEVGKKADMKEPLIVQRGATVRDVCSKLHKDFVKKFKYIRLWGPTAKFDGQMIRNLKKPLQDGDIVEIHLS